MRNYARFSSFWAVLFSLMAVIAGAWGYRQHERLADVNFLRHRLSLLEGENIRFKAMLEGREKADALGYEVAERKKIETAVVRIRELGFARPVIYDVLSREDIQKTLEAKLSEQYTDQEFKNVGTSLATFGLLDSGYPLKRKLIELLGEQVAAFYDPHKHKLFMFEDASLNKVQNRIVLAHELTHALQDQHFDLLKMSLEVKNNDDLALATSALIEGDATVAMTDFMLQNASLKSLRENLGGMFSQNMDQLASAPRYLREMLLFPYLRGQEFCSALRAKGGYEAITNAFKNPPVSSAQILHPEKYFDEPRENPIPIDFGETTVLGMKPLADNVLGEMGIRILFTEWLDPAIAREASQGWRGDRYLVFDEGRGLIWKSIWASPEQARIFSDALLHYADKRFAQVVEISSSPPLPSGSPAARNFKIRSERSNEVVFTYAMKKEWEQALNAKFKN